MNDDDMANESLTQLYHMLRNGLNDMIEGDRLTEADVPDDFEWLTTRLNQIAQKEKQAETEQNNETEEDQGLVITGNPVDGYQYFGPFTSVDDAMANCGLISFMDPDWWVAPLQDAAKVSSKPAQD